jgi:hypothetical protein
VTRTTQKLAEGPFLSLKNHWVCGTTFNETHNPETTESDEIFEMDSSSMEELEDIAFNGYENAYGDWEGGDETSTSQSRSGSSSSHSDSDSEGSETSSTSSFDPTQMLSL